MTADKKKKEWFTCNLSDQGIISRHARCVTRKFQQKPLWPITEKRGAWRVKYGPLTESHDKCHVPDLCISLASPKDWNR